MLKGHGLPSPWIIYPPFYPYFPTHAMLSAKFFIFLAVIYLLSGSFTPQTPSHSLWFNLLGSAGVVLTYYVLLTVLFRRARTRSYFRLEDAGFFCALLCFAFLLYGFDLNYYLAQLPLAEQFSIFGALAGLSLFFLLLVLLWLVARNAYGRLFFLDAPTLSFVWDNIKQNLPIVLPWIIFMIGLDLFQAIFPAAATAEDGSNTEALLVILFLLVVLNLFFPPLIAYFWNCTPISASAQREHLTDFLHRQRFRVHLRSWPLHHGRALTAAIVGIVPGLRYLLLTPALCQTLAQEELEAVLAHEIGHVRYGHVLLFFFLLCGVSGMMMNLAPLWSHFILASPAFVHLAHSLPLAPENLADLLTTLPLLILVILFFRFVIGFFARSFERQADLYAFKVQGDASGLIHAFHSIARASGLEEKRNWHHYTMDERVAYLQHCQDVPGGAERQTRKVVLSLLVYFVCVLVVVFSAQRADSEKLAARAEIQYTEMILQNRVSQGSEEKRWLITLGDFYAGQKMEQKALAAYEKAFILAPDDPTLCNNMSWLLLTAEDTRLHDGKRALILAEQALIHGLGQRRDAAFLDTLAMAYWANGNRDAALKLEAEALEKDPENSEYYRKQQQKYQQEQWNQPTTVRE